MDGSDSYYYSITLLSEFITLLLKTCICTGNLRSLEGKSERSAILAHL